MPKDLEMAYRYDKDQIKEARGRGESFRGCSTSLAVCTPHSLVSYDLGDVGYMPAICTPTAYLALSVRRAIDCLINFKPGENFAARGGASKD